MTPQEILLGIILPLGVLLFSTSVTIWLYLHFSKQIK